MSTAENKLDLVQLIVESNDKTFISKVLDYARALKKNKNSDWSDELPEHVLNELKLAIEEADKGVDSGVSHNTVIEKHRKRYPNLSL
jgi:hypothetical protein